MHRAILESFTALCWTVASPLAYKAIKALERRDFGWLISQRVKPTDYLCPRLFLGDTQIAGFFSKYKDFTIPNVDRKAKALESFWEGEKQCYRSNEHLSPLIEDIGHYGEGVKTFIRTWQRVVLMCLHKTPNYEALRNVRFGPGSTYANVGDSILLSDKLTSGYTITNQATMWLPFLEQSAWLRPARPSIDTGVFPGLTSTKSLKLTYARRFFSEVRGNRFTTVDKNAETDRGISIEASANVSFQLAMGKEISKALKKTFSWDKRTCQGYHRNLARIGSLTGAIATIDLSNASDTVSKNLVKLLLPPAWYRLLDDLRSHHTLVGDRWVKLEKFSSMGNGFTFELETLIFRSLIETVRILDEEGEDPTCPIGVDYSVFGDDIICPSRVSSSVVAALTFFGFKTNVKKTFLKGPFRESCGGDYYRGYDVRPSHIREDSTHPAQLIALANNIQRFRKRFENAGTSSPRTVHIWRSITNHIPVDIRKCRGPEELGDLVIHDHESVWLSNTRTRSSIRYIRVWRPVPNEKVSWNYYRPDVVMACALYGVPSGTPSIEPGVDSSESYRRSGVIPRIAGNYVSGYRFGRVPYS